MEGALKYSTHTFGFSIYRKFLMFTYLSRKLSTAELHGQKKKIAFHFIKCWQYRKKRYIQKM